tara:strand:+ start:117 stop:515 length:399 start_codon:yes stop_codon:yes gene_type:complete
MIFVDANVFLAYDNINDVHHHQAVMLFQKIVKCHYGDPFTSDYVFNEVVGVTFRKKGKERALVLGNHLQKSLLILNVDDHLLNEAWNIFSTTPLGLNLVDCTNLVLAKLARTNYIATFDNEFEKVKNIQIIK